MAFGGVDKPAILPKYGLDCLEMVWPALQRPWTQRFFGYRLLFYIWKGLKESIICEWLIISSNFYALFTDFLRTFKKFVYILTLYHTYILNKTYRKVQKKSAKSKKKIVQISRNIDYGKTLEKIRKKSIKSKA